MKIRIQHFVNSIYILSVLATIMPMYAADGEKLSEAQERTARGCYQEIIKILGSTRAEVEQLLGDPISLPIAVEQEMTRNAGGFSQYSKSFLFEEHDLRIEFKFEFGVTYDHDWVKSVSIMVPVINDDSWVIDHQAVDIRPGIPGVAENLLVSEMKAARDKLKLLRVSRSNDVRGRLSERVKP